MWFMLKVTNIYSIFFLSIRLFKGEQTSVEIQGLNTNLNIYKQYPHQLNFAYGDANYYFVSSIN
jgi:hypothetical protein